MQALHEQNQTSGSYSFGTYRKLLKRRDATCCIALLAGDTVMDPTATYVAGSGGGAGSEGRRGGDAPSRPPASGHGRGGTGSGPTALGYPILHSGEGPAHHWASPWLVTEAQSGQKGPRLTEVAAAETEALRGKRIVGFCKAPEISGRRKHKTENGKPQGKDKRKDNGIKGIPQMKKEQGPVWGQRSKDDLQKCTVFLALTLNNDLVTIDFTKQIDLSKQKTLPISLCSCLYNTGIKISIPKMTPKAHFHRLLFHTDCCNLGTHVRRFKSTDVFFQKQLTIAVQWFASAQFPKKCTGLVEGPVQDGTTFSKYLLKTHGKRLLHWQLALLNRCAEESMRVSNALEKLSTSYGSKQEGRGGGEAIRFYKHPLLSDLEAERSSDLAGIPDHENASSKTIRIYTNQKSSFLLTRPQSQAEHVCYRCMGGPHLPFFLAAVQRGSSSHLSKEHKNQTGLLQ
ncbi:hypothetical protein Anapl_05344 [Anas platyrhynchos]|uniref:Uncharacterized protein n=1 Tax=Anas platyrhynchos TaxID=8839 RepID=R0K046_ANAPL|nr:hypothetical protein Anapl_05344 [Anas platyrhynchos]